MFKSLRHRIKNFLDDLDEDYEDEDYEDEEVTRERNRKLIFGADEYNNVQIKHQIQIKENELQHKKQDLEKIKNLINKNYEEYLQEITFEVPNILPNDMQIKKEYYMKNFSLLENSILERMKIQLKGELYQEQKELENIKHAIKLINDLQLKL